MHKILFTFIALIPVYQSFSQSACTRLVTDFGTSSGNYTMVGSATLTDSAGVLQLSLSSDFSTGAGPDLYLHLSINDQAPTVPGNTNVEVAKLLSNTGAQSYIVPGNYGIDDFDYVTVHCKAFNAFWDGGALGSKTCTNVSTNSFATINQTVCDSYVSPSGAYTWTTTGTFTDTLIGGNITGGDSIITINLTVNVVDTSVTNTNSTLIANATGATYQWLDCGTMLPLSGATNQLFTASDNGFYAVIITQNGCSDTSSCRSITIVDTTNSPIVCTRSVPDFGTSSGGYTVDGSATLIDSAGVLRLTLSSDFSTDPGPDLYLFLSINDEAPTVSGNTNVEVAQLLSSTGAQSYVVPGGYGIDDFDYVTVHCKAFNAFWDGGTLGPQTCTNTPGSTFSTINPTVCDSYVSPSGDYTWASTGTYTDILVGGNVVGGDSIITINLTVIDIDTSVTNTNSAFTANATGATYQWFDCGTMLPIAGETNQTFAALDNGFYAVIITQNSCSDTSSCHTITTVGIRESILMPDILVYPNPTSGRIVIDMNQEGNNGIIKITNTMGQVISETNLSSTHETILKIEGPKGFYFLDIHYNQGDRATLKVLKK